MHGPQAKMTCRSLALTSLFSSFTSKTTTLGLEKPIIVSISRSRATHRTTATSHRLKQLPRYATYQNIICSSNSCTPRASNIRRASGDRLGDCTLQSLWGRWYKYCSDWSAILMCRTLSWCLWKASCSKGRLDVHLIQSFHWIFSSAGRLHCSPIYL